MPIFTVMKSQFQRMSNDNSNTKFIVWALLAEAFIAEINLRFAHAFSDNNVKLATVVHHLFKFDWVDNVTIKAELTSFLKQAICNLS